MPNPRLKIWSNAWFPEPAKSLLADGTAGHGLFMADNLEQSNLANGKADSRLADCDIVFGQIDPQAVLDCPNIKWIHLTTAGYERYDTPAFRQALRQRGTILTTSSTPYAEPCAQHVVSLMLALARRLPLAMENQRGQRAWPADVWRPQSELLTGKTALLLGFGSIGRRLVDLLHPFGMDLMAVRRTARGDEPIPTHSQSETEKLLPLADHVINILPGGPATRSFMSAARFALVKPGATFYNIGRGTTVDQPALIEALRSARLSAAYLDVTDPEPLPPDHPLWSAPNCFITPHTAGGQRQEFERIVEHFVANLRRYERGQALDDRVI